MRPSVRFLLTRGYQHSTVEEGGGEGAPPGANGKRTKIFGMVGGGRKETRRLRLAEKEVFVPIKSNGQERRENGRTSDQFAKVKEENFFDMVSFSSFQGHFFAHFKINNLTFSSSYTGGKKHRIKRSAAITCLLRTPEGHHRPNANKKEDIYTREGG